MTEEIPTGEKTTVPASELEGLVEELYEEADETLQRPEPISEYERGGAHALDWVAPKIEQLIDKHDPKQ
ncbi:hypothetical protein HATV-3_gp81 [Haloarcula tailed virus 3]|uniref:Uncharacterized protein n=1 Tax=Haloarcula tailed virus 3 TaxID=2877990 RepID=A0AAE8XZL6_9CAUD|nr:hypothetical protein M1M35_gp81 [Haloarcula tailed virus 3]UBF23431.1 hypothetical protein HATV-3_gp81 [Haloarcula tailed virus 3]